MLPYNNIRVPALRAGMTPLVFLPGIIEPRGQLVGTANIAAANSFNAASG